MHTKIRSVIKAFAYISLSLFALLANVACPPDQASGPFLEGTYVIEDMEAGIRETWSIDQTGFDLMITIKREGLFNDFCEIRSFEATVNDTEGFEGDGGTATGTLDGMRVDITVSQTEGFLFVSFENSDVLNFDQESNIVDDQNLSCPGQGTGEFVGTWRLSVDVGVEEIWSIVQVDNQLMITRRQIFALDGACVINTFEAVVSDTDPRSASGEAFNLSLSLEINDAGELIAISGGGAPSTYSQTNTAAETLSCPTQNNANFLGAEGEGS